MKAKKTRKKETSSGGSGFGPAISSQTSPSKEKQLTLRSVSGGHVSAGNKALRDAANTFDRIRKQFGPSSSYDIYIRSPLNNATTFWFVGKVAIEQVSDSFPSMSDNERSSSNLNENLITRTYQPTVIDACLSQKRLIFEYSKLHLRPQNLGGPKYGNSLELWYAPGDSEMDVVQNKIVLKQVVGSASSINPNFKNVSMVGFNPEIYVGDEIIHGGLRVQRNESGHPIKPIFHVLEGE